VAENFVCSHHHHHHQKLCIYWPVSKRLFTYTRGTITGIQSKHCCSRSRFTTQHVEGVTKLRRRSAVGQTDDIRWRYTSMQQSDDYCSMKNDVFPPLNHGVTIMGVHDSWLLTCCLWLNRLESSTWRGGMVRESWVLVSILPPKFGGHRNK